MTGIEACFTGRLGRDAELRMVKGGELAMLSFPAAVDQQHQTDDQPPTWIRVALFGAKAEELAPRLLKGARVYVQGQLEAGIWTPDNGGTPRLNLNLTAFECQPLGQIGRARPKTANATRGAQTWNRARHADRSKAQQAGEAVLREARRDRDQDGPPQSWLDDSAAALDHLTYGAGAGR